MLALLDKQIERMPISVTNLSRDTLCGKKPQDEINDYCRLTGTGKCISKETEILYNKTCDFCIEKFSTALNQRMGHRIVGQKSWELGKNKIMYFLFQYFKFFCILFCK